QTVDLRKLQVGHTIAESEIGGRFLPGSARQNAPFPHDYLRSLPVHSPCADDSTHCTAGIRRSSIKPLP
ncbi:MAG TPA: hypothetical protein VK980_16880, partial [Sphingomonas sp.]|nr:hypothetical protein [Sphingomonas sp.]